MNPESWTKNFRGFIMRKRHSVKEREKAVRRCLAGKSVKLVSKELGIKDNYIYEWVERYKMYGREGLEKQPYHEWSFEEKREIVSAYQEKGVPLHTVSSRYRVSQSEVSKWAKAVRERGYAALLERKRKGRPPKDMGRPRKKEPETELEKLRAENERLRTENALLKKVQALVAERIAREEGSGRKPSSR